MRSGPPVGQPRPALTMVDAADATTTVELISGKWIAPVLVALATGPQRYARLSQTLGRRVAKKVLVETLHRMERTRLLTKHSALDDGQLSVRYALTPRGRSLLPVIAGLARWGRTDASRGDPGPIRDR
jgi:DNA-binding HxlR family transcriptional regulator